MNHLVVDLFSNLVEVEEGSSVFRIRQGELAEGE